MSIALVEEWGFQKEERKAFFAAGTVVSTSEDCREQEGSEKTCTALSLEQVDSAWRDVRTQGARAVLTEK